MLKLRVGVKGERHAKLFVTLSLRVSEAFRWSQKHEPFDIVLGGGVNSPPASFSTRLSLLPDQLLYLAFPRSLRSYPTRTSLSLPSPLIFFFFLRLGRISPHRIRTKSLSLSRTPRGVCRCYARSRNSLVPGVRDGRYAKHHTGSRSKAVGRAINGAAPHSYPSKRAESGFPPHHRHRVAAATDAPSSAHPSNVQYSRKEARYRSVQNTNSNNIFPLT